MRRQENIDRVWEIIEKVGVRMLTTRFAGGLRARPLEARPEHETGLIWFVTDLRSDKEQGIAAEHDVGLVFIDVKEKAYLSVTARAEVRRDPAKAAEIWRKTDDAWWGGPNDPNVACCACARSPPNCGVARRAPRSPPSSSPRHGSPARSRT